MIKKLITGLILAVLMFWGYREYTNKATGQTPTSVKSVVGKFDQLNIRQSAYEELVRHRGKLLQPGAHSLEAGRQYWIEIAPGSDLLWDKESHMSIWFYDPTTNGETVQKAGEGLILQRNSMRRWMGIRSDNPGSIVLRVEPIR